MINSYLGKVPPVCIGRPSSRVYLAAPSACIRLRDSEKKNKINFHENGCLVEMEKGDFISVTNSCFGNKDAQYTHTDKRFGYHYLHKISPQGKRNDEKA